MTKGTKFTKIFLEFIVNFVVQMMMMTRRENDDKSC